MWWAWAWREGKEHDGASRRGVVGKMQSGVGG